MRFKGTSQFSHHQPDRIGVLLLNLGTPDAATPAALRRYLAEFLWDPRVVEIPRPAWWLILHGIILRTRPAKSAKAYAKIWREEGSPLLVETLAIQTALQQLNGDDLVFEVGMRYGNPSIESAIEKLLGGGARKILVLPLYPQYSGATTAATFDALAQDFKKRRWIPDLRFVSHYHDFEPYIDSCCNAIEEHWQHHGKPDKLVLSYHGVPQFYLDKGDPYFCECQKTSRLIIDKLGLPAEDCLTTFQSRFGRAEWLQPYTEATLKTLPITGVKHVQVFCPGFAADCLETLEEIDEENRAYFMAAGGENFSYIPALNASATHIAALTSLIRTNLQGWDLPQTDLILRSTTAKKYGAKS